MFFALTGMPNHKSQFWRVELEYLLKNLTVDEKAMTPAQQYLEYFDKPNHVPAQQGDALLAASYVARAGFRIEHRHHYKHQSRAEQSELKPGHNSPKCHIRVSTLTTDYIRSSSACNLKK